MYKCQHKSTRINTSQHESTRVNTNQHESTRINTSLKRINTSTTRVNTNQQESNTSQHKSIRVWHEFIRLRNYQSLSYIHLVKYNNSLIGLNISFIHYLELGLKEIKNKLEKYLDAIQVFVNNFSLPGANPLISQEWKPYATKFLP